MKKRLLKLGSFILGITSKNLIANDNSCHQIINLKDKTAILKYCLPVAKEYEDKGNLNLASWYYLLSSDFEVNIHKLSKNYDKTKAVQLYKHIGTAYVLKGDMKKAKEYYIFHLRKIASSEQSSKSLKNRLINEYRMMGNELYLLKNTYSNHTKELYLAKKLWIELVDTIFDS